MLRHLKKLSIKQGLETDILSFCKNIQKVRKNNNCRVAMTTT